MAKVVFKPVGQLGWLFDLMEYLPKTVKDSEVIEIEYREGDIYFTHKRTNRRVVIGVVNNTAYLKYEDPGSSRELKVTRNKDYHRQIAEEIHFYFQGIK